jgi:hypothetical protein
MKSPSTIFIIIAIVVLGAGGAYFFLGKKDASTPVSGLVSTNSGTTTGVTGSTIPTAPSTGNQVVELLRNLSTIQLSDAVFQNPSFALLSDISIPIPPITSPGRRNPFAAVGVDNPAAETVSAQGSSTTSETIPPALKSLPGGPSF